MLGGFAYGIYLGFSGRMEPHLTRFVCAALLWVNASIITSTALQVSGIVALANFTEDLLNHKYELRDAPEQPVWSWDRYRNDLIQGKRNPTGLTLSARPSPIWISVCCSSAATVAFFAVSPFVFDPLNCTFRSALADSGSLFLLVIGILLTILALRDYTRSEQ